MRCPNCGTEMNRHAEKPVKTVDRLDPSYADPDLDGAVASIHYCPGCGKIEAVVDPPRS